MPNIGELSEFINASRFNLLVGTDTFIALQDLDIHIERYEERRCKTNGKLFYLYGLGEHWMTFTLLATLPELSTLKDLTELDANALMPETTWKIEAVDISGNTKTMTAVGTLPRFRSYAGPKGFTKYDCFVRITGDSVSIA